MRPFLSILLLICLVGCKTVERALKPQAARSEDDIEDIDTRSQGNEYKEVVEGHDHHDAGEYSIEDSLR